MTVPQHWQGHTWSPQLMRFGIVGTSGLVIGLAILNAMMLLIGHFALANLVAFFGAVTWNFWLHRRFTFASTDRAVTWQWACFMFGSLGGALMNWAVSLSLYHGHAFFERHYNAAALIGVVAGAGLNFLWSRGVVFVRRSSPLEAVS